jgi:putative MATE family efflux protein
MFNNKQLKKLIIPLIIEQLLAVTVGMADIMMVARAGETAVSGVSLVDTLNVLLITLFSSLATGGAVVAAQYLGHKETKEACKAANQLLLAVSCISLLIMGISLLGNQAILRTIYGSKVEKAVMDNAVTYFYITALSFPFLAIYNSCAALFRAMGNSKVSMVVSIIMNIINVGGNAILVLGLRMGVAGVAYPTLVSRAVAAIIMLCLIRNVKNSIHIKNIFKLGFDWKMIRRILNIGVPNGLENSIFQIGKVLVQGITTSFGTVAITANAVGNTIAGLEVIPGSAIGLAMITVVGQCVGAGDLEQAKKYVVKLMKLTYIIIIVLNMGVLLLREPIVGLYSLSSETEALAMKLVIYHSICCCIIWPISFCLPNALRAANDVKNTMVISIISMWVWRIGFSFVLAYGFKMGLMGVWVAMTIDWLFRGICFVTRFVSGKWKRHAYIS